MLEFYIEDLISGVTFNKPLLDENDSRIASPNSPISKAEINLLIKWGIKKVKTEGNITSGHKIPTISEKDILNENSKETNTIEEPKKNTITKKEILTKYSEWLEYITLILNDLSKGVDVERDSIINIIENIMLNVPLSKNTFLSIVQSKESEEYLYGHSLNITILSIIIGDALKYSNANLRLLGISALLADIGMFKVPKHIREKKLALSPMDIKLIKTHPNLSNSIIKKYGKFNDIVAEVSLQIHENYDGSGYPKGIKGDEINEFAKIISIADSFDAMTKKRTFRKEKIPHNIMKELLKNVEKKFDPMIMKIFLMHMAIYPVGSMVQLDTKELGIVIETYKKSPLKPIVKILYDSNYVKVSKDKIKKVDLTKDLNRKIIKVVNPKELGISIVNEIE